MGSGILPKVFELEKQYQNSDYQVLFHARAWYWNFINDMWNMTQALKHDQVVNFDRTSLRYRGDKDIDVASLQKCRERLLNSGPDNFMSSTVGATGCDAEVTCFNHSIVSNNDMMHFSSPRGSEMTAGYFLGAGFGRLFGDEKKLDFVKKLFEQQGLLHCINQHELEELYAMHANLLKYYKDSSELVVMLIHKNHIDKMVYPATPGCWHSRHVNKSSKLLEDEQNATRVDSSFTGTTDHFYALAVSDMPGEYGTPEQKGIYSIKSLHAVKPERYAAYCKKRHELFEKMKQRYHQGK